MVQFSLSPLVMVVHPTVAANSLQDYIQLAKTKPGALTRELVRVFNAPDIQPVIDVSPAKL